MADVQNEDELIAAIESLPEEAQAQFVISTLLPMGISLLSRLFKG